MEFQVNHLDVGTMADALYGISYAVAMDPNAEDWFNSDVQKILSDTSDLLVW